MSLSDWLKHGWLRPHKSSAQEIGDLFAVVNRDLRDCAAKGLSDDWRFGIAYNDALQAAHAALAAAGFETLKGDSHHFRAIQSLEYTIAADQSLVRRFDAFRKKRNAGVYERTGLISGRDADEMIQLAMEVRDRVRDLIRTKHPALLP